MDNDYKSYNIYYKNTINNTILPDNLIKMYIKSFQLYKDYSVRKYIVNSNQRYIAKIAYKYAKQHYILDLVSEGNIGLLKAIDKFDVNKENKFITFASFYINKYILEYIYKYSTTTNTPFNVINNNLKIYNFIHHYFNKHQTNPSIITISKFSGFSKSKIINIINYNEDITQTNNNENINPDTLTNDNKELLKESLKDLSEKERILLFKNFGINYLKKNYSELSKEYNCSKQDIQSQIETILKKIKNEQL